jgi:hypothetical protein
MERGSLIRFSNHTFALTNAICAAVDPDLYEQFYGIPVGAYFRSLSQDMMVVFTNNNSASLEPYIEYYQMLLTDVSRGACWLTLLQSYDPSLTADIVWEKYRQRTLQRFLGALPCSSSSSSAGTEGAVYIPNPSLSAPPQGTMWQNTLSNDKVIHLSEPHVLGLPKFDPTQVVKVQADPEVRQWETIRDERIPTLSNEIGQYLLNHPAKAILVGGKVLIGNFKGALQSLPSELQTKTTGLFQEAIALDRKLAQEGKLPYDNRTLKEEMLSRVTWNKAKDIMRAAYDYFESNPM